MIFLTIVFVLWTAWKLGKEEGKWGLLIGIGMVVLVGLFAAAVKLRNHLVAIGYGVSSFAYRMVCDDSVLPHLYRDFLSFWFRSFCHIKIIHIFFVRGIDRTTERCHNVHKTYRFNIKEIGAYL